MKNVFAAISGSLALAATAMSLAAPDETERLGLSQAEKAPAAQSADEPGGHRMMQDMKAKMHQAKPAAGTNPEAQRTSMDEHMKLMREMMSRMMGEQHAMMHCMPGMGRGMGQGGGMGGQERGTN